MKTLKVCMYTYGTGSGHLTRINAVYKGFIRAGYTVDFAAIANRSKYIDFLDPGIRLCSRGSSLSKTDIFICDWRSDDYVDRLPRRSARVWVGLRRLGKMPAAFPEYFHVVAIEPNVKGDTCIWPIISTWPDELLTRRQFERVVSVPRAQPVALLCENGAYPKHLGRVFAHPVPAGTRRVRCSTSPYSKECRDLCFYPVARLFRAADFLVVGAGYNSVHEALSYADLSRTTMVRVGGDDQAIRLRHLERWECGRGSQAEHLAHYLCRLLDEH